MRSFWIEWQSFGQCYRGVQRAHLHGNDPDGDALLQMSLNIGLLHQRQVLQLGVNVDGNGSGKIYGRRDCIFLTLRSGKGGQRVLIRHGEMGENLLLQLGRIWADLGKV